MGGKKKKKAKHNLSAWYKAFCHVLHLCTKECVQGIRELEGFLFSLDMHTLTNAFIHCSQVYIIRILSVNNLHNCNNVEICSAIH